MTLRNVLTNEESDVTEHTGSLGAQSGGVLFAALINLAGKCQAIGTAPYSLPPSSIQTLIEARKSLLKRNKTKQLKDEHLLAYDIEIRTLYFELLEPLLNPQQPTLCNTDGDLFELQTLHFEIEDSDEAFNALQSISAEFVSAEDVRSKAKIQDGRVVEAEIPWIKKKSKTSRHPGSNVLAANIMIAGTKLTVQVNSSKRAAAIKRKILTALGDKVKFKLKSMDSIERAIEYLPSRGSEKSSLISADQLPPEIAESIAKMAEEHWVKWFDTKIPALNDRTPKQAVRSKEGRELLEALLNLYEQGMNVDKNEATNLFNPDVKMIRSKLGLTQDL